MDFVELVVDGFGVGVCVDGGDCELCVVVVEGDLYFGDDEVCGWEVGLWVVVGCFFVEGEVVEKLWVGDVGGVNVSVVE